MPKPKDTPVFDLEVAIPALVAALGNRMVLRKSDLKALRVPAAFQGSVLHRLEEEGFEAVKNGVRVPLRLQLETLLKERGVLGGPIGKHLKGGTPKSCKELLKDLAQEGSIHLLIRGRAEAVVGRGASVLSREELRALGQLAVSVQKAQRSKPVPRTLLREDIREVLPDLGDPGQGPRIQTDLVDHLALECRRLLKADLGLCFVPELVVSCLRDHALRSVHKALAQAVREGRIELRPESGLNRLSAVELSLCPEGLQGTRLSWARPLELEA